MSAALPFILAVTLLSGSEEAFAPVVQASIVDEEDVREAESDAPRQNAVESARITAARSDFDREEGVILFDGNVRLEYSGGYRMDSDRLFAFISGSNELSRVVAIGNVAVSNDNRTGSCALAEFRRDRAEVEMYGAAGGEPARLSEGFGGNVLTGAKIKFWLNAEQVEVADSTIEFARGGFGL